MTCHPFQIKYWVMYNMNMIRHFFVRSFCPRSMRSFVRLFACEPLLILIVVASGFVCCAWRAADNPGENLNDIQIPLTLMRRAHITKRIRTKFNKDETTCIRRSFIRWSSVSLLTFFFTPRSGFCFHIYFFPIRFRFVSSTVLCWIRFAIIWLEFVHNILLYFT